MTQLKEPQNKHFCCHKSLINWLTCKLHEHLLYTRFLDLQKFVRDMNGSIDLQNPIKIPANGQSQKKVADLNQHTFKYTYIQIHWFKPTYIETSWTCSK